MGDKNDTIQKQMGHTAGAKEDYISQLIRCLKQLKHIR